ncbi:MAG: sugar ABC transporter substrate-binding protein [Candidatus Izimaplasma sp.]|nr:sugar ABC transporter substrate-binding protein [Candidatus Izimaplasma bacterium]
MKKFYSVVLIGILILTLLACNGDSEGKTEVTIGFWPESNLSSDVEMYEDWERMFEEDYPEYDIVGRPYTYSTDDFAALASTGNLPIVFETWFTEPEKLVSKGYVRDITDILVELEWLDKLDDEMRQQLTFDEKIYGIPRDGYGLGLFLNLEIFEMVGLMEDINNDGIIDIYDNQGNPLYPTTMQELYDTATYISNTMQEYYEEEVAGLVILSANKNGGWQFSNLAWNFGESLQIYNESSGTWKANLNSEASLKAMQWIYDLKWTENALPQTPSLTYSDWYFYIGNNMAAMSFVGSDAINLPVTNYGMNKDNIAFVPIPAGFDSDENRHQYTLFGGTPYMFSDRATDEQVRGALLFMEYIGRSPLTTDIAQQSVTRGMVVAQEKGMTIVPSIKPWKNTEYLEMMETIESVYVNVYMPNFEDFYDNLQETKRPEEPYYTQEMYEILDSVIQQILTNENADIEALLNSANSNFETNYMSQVNTD